MAPTLRLSRGHSGPGGEDERRFASKIVDRFYVLHKMPSSSKSSRSPGLKQEVRKGRRRTTSCMSRFDALTDSMTTGNLALHPSYLKLPYFNAFQRLIPVQNDVKMSVFFFIYAVPVYPYGVCPLVKPSSPTLPPSVNPTGIFNRTSEANFNLRFFGFRRRVSEG